MGRFKTALQKHGILIGKAADIKKEMKRLKMVANLFLQEGPEKEKLRDTYRDLKRELGNLTKETI